jgi:SPP1 gp7 family putative phage head morphogenesis protein
MSLACYNELEINEIAQFVYQSEISRLPYNIETESLADLFNTLNARMEQIKQSLPKILQLIMHSGGSKVLNKDGQKLAFKQPNYKLVIDKLMEDNLQYAKNLNEVQRQQILKQIRFGIKKGLTYNDMAANIVKKTTDIGLERAVMIASTESNKAHAQAMYETMELNGVKSYMWLTAGDDRVAPLDQALNNRIFKFNEPGTMNVRGTDGKTYTISASPRPVTDTHPRCRCVIIANV